MSDNTKKQAVDMFESQLKRFKEVLSLEEDQEAAHALGMSKAAFSYRKRTGSFPAEHLITLKARRPELDVQYILFGEQWAAPEDSEATEKLLQGAASLGLSGNELARAVAIGLYARLARAVQNAKVRSLLEVVEWCDDDAIDLLVRLAAKLRGPKAIPFDSRGNSSALTGAIFVDPPYSTESSEEAIPATHSAGLGKLATTLNWVKSLPADERVLFITALDEAHRSTPLQTDDLRSTLAKAGNLSAPGLTATPRPNSRRSPPAAKSASRASKKPQRA